MSGDGGGEAQNLLEHERLLAQPCVFGHGHRVLNARIVAEALLLGVVVMVLDDVEHKSRRMGGGRGVGDQERKSRVGWRWGDGRDTNVRFCLNKTIAPNPTNNNWHATGDRSQRLPGALCQEGRKRPMRTPPPPPR